jgi:hypothetical protein
LVHRLGDQIDRVGELKVAVGGFLAMKTPRFTLGGRDQPRSPAAIAIGLIVEELSPCVCTGVVDDVGRRLDLALHDSSEPTMKTSVELALVTQQPIAAMFAGGSWSVVRVVIRPKF